MAPLGGNLLYDRIRRGESSVQTENLRKEGIVLWFEFWRITLRVLVFPAEWIIQSVAVWRECIWNVDTYRRNDLSIVRHAGNGQIVFLVSGYSVDFVRQDILSENRAWPEEKKNSQFA